MECAAWDGQVVRQDSSIAELREQFVLVRITRMNGVDLERFAFDYDTTWAGFFLDAELNIYSRFGGRDESRPEGRMHLDALATTMRAVLDSHHHRDKARPLIVSVRSRRATPEDIPLLARDHRGCVHCHEVQEYRLRQAASDGTFSSQQLFQYPVPESLGLQMDLRHGFRVAECRSGSPAERSGIRSGDVIERIAASPVRSEFDLRWALSQIQPLADGRDHIAVTVRRAKSDPVLDLQIEVTGAWRQSDLSWRKSLRSVPVDWGFRAYDLSIDERREYELPDTGLALRVISVSNQGLADAIGLKKGDVMLHANDIARQLTFDQWKSRMLGACEPGTPLSVQVWRDRQRIELRGVFPRWSRPE